MAMNLDLIQVPDGWTSELQPLDVGFNGFMLMKRKQIWAQHTQTFESFVRRFSATGDQARASQLLRHVHLHCACCIQKGWIIVLDRVLNTCLRYSAYTFHIASSLLSCASR
jgi:hypothetical protein